jgi:hypothetical protein
MWPAICAPQHVAKKKKKKKKNLDGAAPSARQIVAPAKNRKEPRCATPHHQCFTIHLSRLSKKKSWLRPKKMSFRVLFRKKNVLSCPELTACNFIKGQSSLTFVFLSERCTQTDVQQRMSAFAFVRSSTRFSSTMMHQQQARMMSAHSRLFSAATMPLLATRFLATKAPRT